MRRQVSIDSSLTKYSLEGDELYTVVSEINSKQQQGAAAPAHVIMNDWQSAMYGANNTVSLPEDLRQSKSLSEWPSLISLESSFWQSHITM